MTETTPEYLAGPPTEVSDARDWLKAQLSNGMDRAPLAVHAFLEALHWRQRSVCVLIYAERMTQEQVSWLLGISPRTVWSDLQDVCTLAAGIEK